MYENMIDTIGAVAAVDPELGAAMNRELHRQRQNIELIASENIVSPAVMAAMGSILTNKYAEGYPVKRYYGGCMYGGQGKCGQRSGGLFQDFFHGSFPSVIFLWQHRTIPA